MVRVEYREGAFDRLIPFSQSGIILTSEAFKAKTFYQSFASDLYGVENMPGDLGSIGLAIIDDFQDVSGVRAADLLFVTYKPVESARIYGFMENKNIYPSFKAGKPSPIAAINICKNEYSTGWQNVEQALSIGLPIELLEGTEYVLGSIMNLEKNTSYFQFQETTDQPELPRRSLFSYFKR